MENVRNPNLGARVAIGVGLIAALVAGAFVTGRPAVNESPRRVAMSETRALMSTWITITVIGDDRAAARRNVNAAFSEMERVASILNAHNPDSELNRLNAAAGKDAMAVSPELYGAVRAGVDWWKRTGGAFDISVAPLLDLWKQCGKEDRLPTEEELATARRLLCVDRIELDDARRTVRLPAGGRLNLGGHGKGYVVQWVVEYLRKRGVTDALVAGSGDIYALGRKPDGLSWVVGIQDPRDAGKPAVLGKLVVSDRAVSTSGNYQRYVTIQGRRHSHIIDPRTGQSADAVPSVTVIGPDAVTTDVLDTALSVLGPEAGVRLAESLPDVAALFVLIDDSGRPVSVRSAGFVRYEAP